MSDPQQTQDEGTEETFISHLVELRDRIIRAGLAVIVVFIGLVYWAPDIFRLLARPLMQNLPKDGKMIVTDVTGSFFVPMKVTMMVAFVIALPVVLYQIWAFVAPGLYRHEKKLVVPLVGSSYTLFLCGMAFAYFVVFPTIFRVMAHYNAPLGAEMTTDIDNYLSFVLTMFLAFGVTFEVPIVVVLLVRMNVLTIKKLKRNPSVCDRWRVRDFGRGDAAGRVLATDSGDSADRAVRGGDHCGAVDCRQATGGC